MFSPFLQLVDYMAQDFSYLGYYCVSEAPEPGYAIGYLTLYSARYATLPGGYSTSVKPGGKPIRASTHAGFSLPPGGPVRPLPRLHGPHPSD